MARKATWAAAGVALAVCAGAAPPQPAQQPRAASPQLVQAARLAAQQAAASPYQKVQRVSGVAAASVDPAAKKIWVMALHAATGPNTAEAGLRLAPVSAGAQMPATVTATFAITRAEGLGTVVRLLVNEVNNPMPVAERSADPRMAKPSVTLTTGTFTLQPKREYVVTGLVAVDPGEQVDGAAWAVVTLTDVKWQF